MSNNCSDCWHHEVCIARHNAGHDNTCYTDCGGYCTEFLPTKDELVYKNEIKKSISVMQNAYNTYNAKARQCLANDNLHDDYWYYTGLAEGTRRSWELLEELFGLKEEEEEETIECDGRCLNCDYYNTSACPDNK